MLDMMRPGRVEIPSCSHDSRIKTVELGKDIILPLCFMTRRRPDVKIL